MKNKYLVQRLDGSVPRWPWFVLGARDPAAHVALKAYVDEAEKLGMDPDYVDEVRLLLADMRRHAVTYGFGNPGMGVGFRPLNPEVTAKLGLEDPNDPQPVLNTAFLGCRVDFESSELAQPFMTVVPHATVLDDQQRVIHRGNLFVCNMHGLRLSRLSPEEATLSASRTRAYRGVIDFLAPRGGMAEMVVKTRLGEEYRTAFNTEFGFRQLCEGFDVANPVDLIGKEIVYTEDLDGHMLAFMPWDKWVRTGREEFEGSEVVCWQDGAHHPQK